QPTTGHGPLPVPTPKRVLGLDRTASTGIRRVEQGQLLALAKVRCLDAEQPHLEATDLRSSQVERGGVDRVGQVCRCDQRALPGDRVEAAVPDLDGDRAGLDAGGPE